jgi:hypothetical protein
MRKPGGAGGQQRGRTVIHDKKVWVDDGEQFAPRLDHGLERRVVNEAEQSQDFSETYGKAAGENTVPLWKYRGL